MSFAEAIQIGDVAAMSLFGEQVTYYPRAKRTAEMLADMATGGNMADLEVMAVGGNLPAGEAAPTARTITAIVDRYPAQPMGASPFGQSRRLTITVYNDSTLGISSSEIDIGGDAIEVSERIGKTAVRKKINSIISQDDGMMELELI